MDGDDQPRLWQSEEQVVPEDLLRLREQVNRWREAWTTIRRTHAIGSAEEQQYRDAYWQASGQLLDRERGANRRR